MNKLFIGYNLQEAQEEIEIILKAMKTNPNYSHEEFYRSMQHLIHHVNIAYNGRNAPEQPTEAQVEAYSQFPTDIKLI